MYRLPLARNSLPDRLIIASKLFTFKKQIRPCPKDIDFNVID